MNGFWDCKHWEVVDVHVPSGASQAEHAVQVACPAVENCVVAH